MAAGDQDQGYVPLYQPGGQKQGQTQTTPVQQTTPAAPAAPVRDPNDQGYVPLVGAPKAPPPVVTSPPSGSGASQQPADWSIDWSKGGEVKLPQSVQDWSTLAAQNSLMGLYPGLNAQADAARKRLDPVTAASADVAGGAISPSTLLNAVPVVGPELAGGVHEGLKSYAAGNDWKTIGEDTAGGAAAGLAGQGAALAAAKALPTVIAGGVTGGAGYLGHKLLGGFAAGDLMKEAPGLMGLYKMVDKTADWAGEKGKDLISSPAAQQAIKNLVLGAGSAFRQGTGSYDQWIPGQ